MEIIFLLLEPHYYKDYAPYHHYDLHGAPLEHGHHLPHVNLVEQPHDITVAHGYDKVGPFHHYTGPFGPFGFYANFYHNA